MPNTVYYAIMKRKGVGKMSFDGIFIHHLIKELQVLKGARIQKIYQISTFDLLLYVRVEKETKKLLISTSNESSRIHFTKYDYDIPATPSSFTMFLRKHFDGGIIKDIYQYQSDRIIILDILTTNEMKDKIVKKLCLEATGRTANLIILQDNKILEAIKHSSFLDEKARTILPNAIYTPLENNKFDTLHLHYEQIYNFFASNSNITSKEIQNRFAGLSLMACNEINSVYDKAKRLNSLINDPIKPCIMDYNNKKYFYFQPVNHLNATITNYPDLSSLLDDYFYEKDKINRIKQKSDDIYKFVLKQIEKNKNKLEKLKHELQNSLDNEIYKIKGEILLANCYLKDYNRKKIQLFNYYNNEYIDINLDEKLNLAQNANKYFAKYQKAKNAIKHLKEQIEITKNEIDYFTLIECQLKLCDVNDSLEIKQELIDQRYLKNDSKAKKQKKEIGFLKFYTSDNTPILVGKNNVQNEYLTHKLAKANEMWFHVKDAPGSHVIVQKTSPLNEEEIRTAALLASYYSPFKDSSSVPVCYTQVRYIKKIPGKRPCFVTFSHEKTIFIDPDISLINAIKTKKD